MKQVIVSIYRSVCDRTTNKPNSKNRNKKLISQVYLHLAIKRSKKLSAVESRIGKKAVLDNSVQTVVLSILDILVRMYVRSLENLFYLIRRKKCKFALEVETATDAGYTKSQFIYHMYFSVLRSKNEQFLKTLNWREVLVVTGV